MMNHFCRWRVACLWAWLACGSACLAVEQTKVRPGRLIPMLGEDQGNLVPNASFECGTDGWGSAELDFLPGWNSSLNKLFGRLDPTTAADGHASLKIELTPENQPIAYADYFHTQHHRIKAPLAANIGWIAVKPGQKYTFSVAMKAAEDGTPARLVVRQFRAVPIEKPVRLTTIWQRYKLEFTPEAEACYILAGPVLRSTEGHPQAPDRATVWLDAVRLAPSEMKTPFTTRQPVELGVTTDKRGNIFSWDEPLRFHLTVASNDRHQQHNVEIALRLTDFFDQEVWHDTLSPNVPAGSSWEEAIVLSPSPQRRGFLRLEATMTSGRTIAQRRMRLAATPVYTLADSRFRPEPRLRLAGSARAKPAGRGGLDARLVAKMAGRGAQQRAVHVCRDRRRDQSTAAARPEGVGRACLPVEYVVLQCAGRDSATRSLVLSRHAIAGPRAATG